MFAARTVALLCMLLAAGCACLESTPPREPPAAGAAAVPKPSAPVSKDTAAAPSRSAEAKAKPAAEPALPMTPKPAAPVAGEPVTRPAAAPAKPSTNDKGASAPAAKAPVSAAPKEPAAKKADPAPAPDRPAALPPLDLTSLEQRLKETNAIGVFTKLTLKNQVDDLLNRFRAYYEGRLKTTLAELRQPFDLLILKVLTLLQDGDPSLASAIRSSREAIWGILSDPVKFSKLVS